MHEAAQGLLARHVLQPPKIEIVEPQIALEGGFEHFEVEPLLALEMIVDRRLIDARFGDNRPNACAVIASLGEQGDRGLYDAVARVFGGAGHSHPDEKFKQVFECNLLPPTLRCNRRMRRLPCSAAASLTILSFRPIPRSSFGHKRVFEFQMTV